MRTQQWLTGWLAVGLLWFLVAITLFPSHKPYHQGLIFFYWLPVVVLLATRWTLLKELWPRAWPILTALGLLIAWAAMSLLWSPDEDGVRQLRRLLFVALFLCGFALFGLLHPERVTDGLRLACHLLAFSCLLALLYQYAVLGDWERRAGGMGLLEHPIMGGYAIAVGSLLLIFLPHSRARWLWSLSLLAMLVLMVMTQSRGLWVALLGALLIMALLRGDRLVWIITGLLLSVAAVGLFQFQELVLERGVSHRPDILQASLDLIQQRPWLGLGLGGSYEFQLVDLLIPHSHNLYAHVAIELGLVGLGLWLAVWVSAFWVAWQHRQVPLGRALLAVLLFCSLAQLFDGGQLWSSPRAEWFFTWLPIALALCLRCATKSQSCLVAEQSPQY